MTVQEMVDSVSILREINEKKMPAKTAYQFARIIREMENELKNFQNIRMKLVERYGKKDENGNLIQDEDGNVEIFSEKKNDFKKEISDLMESKIQINCELINLNELLDNEFTPGEINQLFFCLKEE